MKFWLEGHNYHIKMRLKITLLSLLLFLSNVMSQGSSLSFTKPRYEASVREEQSENLEILRVKVLPFSKDHKYRMESMLDARSQDLFEIDEQTGSIRAVARLDREFMDEHFFKVGLIDRDVTAQVEIRVLDINDHAPSFELGQYNLSVHESVSVGTAIATVVAKDEDSGDNARIVYSINNNNLSLPFTIDSISGVLQLKSQLDREQKDFYNFTVTASDDGFPPRNSSVVILIAILDDNDNHPKFLSDNHTFCIPEDLHFQDRPLVGSIKALDQDLGSNAVLRYSIIGGNIDHTFEMDADTGNLRLVRQLDREKMAKYTLIVRVQDQGRTPKSNTTQVIVEVDDVNDNAPRFPTAVYFQSVVENVKTGYSVLQLNAFDPDQGDNARINYRLNANEDLPFVIERESGWIKTKDALDREKAQDFKFLAEAFDNGNPSLSTSIPVSISVHDANDNDPVFEHKEYSVSVSETMPVGSVVIKLRAFDNDKRGRLRYEIVGGNMRNRFTISTLDNVGVVSVAQPLNVVQDKYLVSVHAVDEGGRFGSCLVHVKVEDANDHVPGFENTPYFVDVFEDVPVGATVLMLHASDDDKGENARISYHLLTQSKHFHVHQQSGALTVLGNLDREQQATYILTVQAKDSGQPPLADVTEVEISVLDTNDNAPVFARASYEGSLHENAARGTKVLRVQASDKDADELGEVRYYLDQTDVSSKAFSIDAISGDIRSNAQLDRESRAKYDLVVIARDGGLPPKESRVDVVIRLIDVNDNPPVFLNSSMEFELNENEEHGARIGEIRVHDPDIGDNAQISFQLLDSIDSRFFYLSDFDEGGGIWLFAKRSFDYEDQEKNVFRIAVRAESTPLRTDADIVVRIRDVNDNAPRVSDSHFIVNCRWEKGSCSRDLGLINAVDPDPTDSLRFSFNFGNKANLLTLDENTGHLSLAQDASNVNLRAHLGIIVSDGLHEANATIRVELNHVTEDALSNSINLNLHHEKSHNFSSNFLEPTMLYLRRALASVLECKESDVVIFGLKLSESHANLTLYVAQNGDAKGALWLKQRVYVHSKMLNQLIGNGWRLKALDEEDICVKEPCLNFENCKIKPKFGGKNLVFRANSITLRVLDSLRTYACNCPKGFTGMNSKYTCDKKINLCYSNPCLNGATCKPTEDNYVCLCSDHYRGKNCEFKNETKINEDSDDDLELCSASVAACSNGREGECSHTDLTMATKNNLDELKCRSRSFSGTSYVALAPLDRRVTFELSLEIATGQRRQSRSLILYNGRLNDRNDFLAITLDSDLGLQLKFSPGGKIMHELSIPISNGPDLMDGKFHLIKIVYNEEEVVLSVGRNCDANLALKAMNKSDYLLKKEMRCANSTSSPVMNNRIKGCNSFLNHCPRFLDLNGPLLLAGLPSGSDIDVINNWSHFEGCIRRLSIDHIDVDMEKVIKNNGSVLGCPAKREHFCSRRPCMNGGHCRETWAGFACSCGDKWTGKDCSSPSAIEIYGLASNESVLQLTKTNLQPLTFPWIHSTSFKTNVENAGLMKVQLGNVDSTLSIEKSKIVYRLRDVEIIMDAPKVSDNEWHHVSVKWMTDEIWLNVDFGQSEATQTFLNSFGGTIVRKVLMGTKGFKGCIKDVEVGSESDKSAMKVLVKQNLISCQELQENSTKTDNISPLKSKCTLLHKVNNTCAGLCELDPCKNEAQICENRAKNSKYECKCRENSNCEEIKMETCPRHWWGRPSCGPCDCDSTRGFNETCDIISGKCSCKAFHYEIEDLCRPCNCYPLGSKSSQCDIKSGQCECKTGVTGRRCEACAHKFAELTSHGCQVVYEACPAEYFQNLWWERANFGASKKAKCPGNSVGNVIRNCSIEQGWSERPDFGDCTHRVFLRLKVIRSKEEGNNEKEDESSNENREFDRKESKLRTLNGVSVESSSDSEESWSQLSLMQEVIELHESEMEQQRLRGDNHHDVFHNDLMIVNEALMIIIKRELELTGFQLAHRKDRLFLPNLVKIASWMLQRQNFGLESRMKLISLLAEYGQILINAMEDTFTNPFELVGSKITLGLDTLDTTSNKERFKRATETNNNNNFFPKYTNFPRSENSWGRVRVKLSLKIAKSSIVQYMLIRQEKKAEVDRDHVMIPQLRMDTRITVFSDLIAFNVNFDNEQIVQFADAKNEDNVAKSHHCVKWEAELEVWSSLLCDTLKTRTTESNIIISCTCINKEENANSMIQGVIEETLGQGQIFVREHQDRILLTLAIMLSTATLMLTLICLCCCNRVISNTLIIGRHLSLNLLMFNLIFGVSLMLNEHLTEQDNHLVCRGMALVLHFGGCSMFSWLMVRSLHFWRMLTELRDIDSGPRMPFYTSVGLGLPAAAVLLSVGVSGRNYAAETRFCFVNTNVVTALGLLLPVLVCSIVTLVFIVANLRICIVANIKMEPEELSRLRIFVLADLLLLPLLITHHLLAVTFINGVLINLAPIVTVLVLSALYLFVELILLDLRALRRTHPRRAADQRRLEPHTGSGEQTGQSSMNKSALIYRQTSGNVGSTQRGRELRDFEAGLSLASTTSRSSLRLANRRNRSNKFMSDDETETDLDQRSFELASSHSSDDDNDANVSSNGGNSSARTLAVHDYPQY